MTGNRRQASIGRESLEPLNGRPAPKRSRFQGCSAPRACPKCKSNRSSRNRPGLAPLELVLALPLMLFVMALIINFGVVGAWKTREQAAVHYASWRTLHLRTGDENPNPPLWPRNPPLRGGTGANLIDVDSLWNGIQELKTSVVRGPAIVDPATGRAIRVNRRLEMDRRVNDGRALFEAKLPLLKNLLAGDGRYRFRIPQNVLDNSWEFHQMGYSGNRDRRARLLYEIEPDDFPSVAVLKARLDARQQALQNFPLAADLLPLDRDPDLVRLGQLPPMGGTAPPDFYPSLGNVCLADPMLIRLTPRYTRFLEQIRRLPGQMGRTFREWYRRRRDYLLDQLSQGMAPPGATQEIQWLDDRINELDQFLGSLPPQNR